MKRLRVCGEIGLKSNEIRQSDVAGIKVDYGMGIRQYKPRWPIQIEIEETDIPRLKKQCIK